MGLTLVDTHGVWQLAGYVERIGMEGINPTAWPEILAETPSSALVSGNWTFVMSRQSTRRRLLLRRPASRTWLWSAWSGLTISAAWANRSNGPPRKA